MARKTYDYIVIGGGSAGSVLGNRLSAAPGTTVLVVEAGHKDSRWDYPVRIPAAILFLMGNPFYDWRYKTEPEANMNGRTIDQFRGKVLGGSSSINGMFYQRANPLTYDGWAQGPGMESWAFANCLPYFKRMETSVVSEPDDPFRGKSGPLIVERQPASSPLFHAFLAAADQAGYAVLPDVNGWRQEGFAPFDSNICRGERMSASRAYLHPVMRRPNLEIRTRALATKLVFENGRAVGVEIRGPGRRRVVERAGEIVLCGGSFNSPQLLQLSGIGNPADLQRVGVTPIHDLPGVGENLQDHMEGFVMYACRQPVSAAPYLKPKAWPKIGAQWFLGRRGPAATSHFEAGGFFRTNEAIEMPNQMMAFLPLGVRNDGTPAPTPHSYQVNLSPQLPESRGHVKLKSADPRQHPEIVLNYLSTERDRRDWVEAVAVARKILGQEAFAPYNDGELEPGRELESDAQILKWVGETATTMYHGCGTCKMGVGTDAVVDPSTMKVHGVDGVRIVDASVFPRIPNANTYAPVMMVAEKAADLILGETPLAPEPIPFYRNNDAASAPTGASADLSEPEIP